MRRFAILALLLPVTACGYNTWWNAPFTTGRSPNTPTGTSDNFNRAAGHDVAVAPLNTTPGDVWPGPPPPVRTLKEIMESGELSPGPLLGDPGAPSQAAPAASQGYKTPVAHTLAPNRTATPPGGGTAIVVPNGNGTSTVINPDGTIQTIPTPR
jgi:hypothetical protein